MKLHFDPNQSHQLLAIEAVCDLIRGQERGHSPFTVIKADAATFLDPAMRFDVVHSNRLNLSDGQ